MTRSRSRPVRSPSPGRGPRCRRSSWRGSRTRSDRRTAAGMRSVPCAAAPIVGLGRVAVLDHVSHTRHSQTTLRCWDTPAAPSQRCPGTARAPPPTRGHPADALAGSFSTRAQNVTVGHRAMSCAAGTFGPRTERPDQLPSQSYSSIRPPSPPPVKLRSSSCTGAAGCRSFR